MDRFSPVAPAAVRVQVLPVGQVEKTRFLEIVQGLRQVASVIRLAEIDGDGESMLASGKFPNGRLLFNYTVSEPTEHQRQLSPFELFRDPLLVVGIADGLSEANGDHVKQLTEAATCLRERHPRVVHRHLLLLQEVDDGAAAVANATVVGQDGEINGQLLRAAVCKIAARFLTELSTYATAMQASPSIQTPGQQSQEPWHRLSLIGSEPDSGYSTPGQSNDISSPVADDDQSRPASRGFGSPPPPLPSGLPATSFDQIQAANPPVNGLARSDSRNSNRSRPGNRAASQERAPTPLSREKTKDRGKARVGIVIGHIHLMAGQWSEALRILAEHTNKARSLADRLWQGKGQEGILVCMLLLSWAGLEFSIPSICYPVAERTSAAHVKRFSVNLPTDFRTPEIAQQASVRRLSNSLPELLKQILDLFRSTEGTIELPLLQVREVTVRFAKLLAILWNASGELSESAFAGIVEGTPINSSTGHIAFSTKNLSRTGIDDLIKSARPNDEDDLVAADTLSLLAGIASVYDLLSMDRKKAATLHDIIRRASSALHHARKLGAAEAGIHPAATLSAGIGPESIATVLTENGGVESLTNELARVYGTTFLIPSDNAKPIRDASAPQGMSASMFGSSLLQTQILKDMTGLCEASPDPEGVLCLTASLMLALNPPAAVDNMPRMSVSPPDATEQRTLSVSLNRTVGVSRQMDLPHLHAPYWDPCLVRDIIVATPSVDKTLIPRKDLGRVESQAQQQVPGNPLLYDPNARHAETGSAKPLLVCDEQIRCHVYLQNPFETAVEIESIQLMTDNEDHQLETLFRPSTLMPMCIQPVEVILTPKTLGDFAIAGCRVKIAGCHEQTFPIMKDAWSPEPCMLVKNHGLNGRKSRDLLSSAPGEADQETTRIALSVVAPQPLLEMTWVSAESSRLTLFEGESCLLQLRLRNISTVDAVLVRHVSPSERIEYPPPQEAGAILLRTGESKTIEVPITGYSHVLDARTDLFYGRATDQGEVDYIRLASMSLRMTIKPSLTIANVDILTLDDSFFVFRADIMSCYRDALAYTCPVLDKDGVWEGTEHDEIIEPGETARIQCHVKRWDIGTSLDPLSITTELFKRIAVKWKTCTREERSGAVLHNTVKLTPEQIETIRGPQVSIILGLMDSDDRQINHAQESSTVRVGSYVTLRVKLTNRHSTSKQPLSVKVQNQSDTRRLAIIGVPTRLIPHCSDEGEAIADFALCPLIAGMSEVQVVVRAVKAGAGAGGEGEQLADRTLRFEAAG